MNRKHSSLKTDKRRKHHHFKVTVVFRDGYNFARVYIDRIKADKFAARQRRCPVVKTARVREINP